MGGIDGLDLAGRAAALGRPCREALQIAELMPLMFVWPLLGSAGAVTRFRRWLDAGRPEPNLKRLAYVGDGGTHLLLVGVLRALPAPIAWHLIEHVTWCSVGGDFGGWMAIAPIVRHPAGDSAHLIALGPGTDEHACAHEGMHSWHRAIVPVVEDAERPAPAVYEAWLANAVVAARGTERDVAREAYLEELLADNSASALGFPPRRHSSDSVRFRQFEADVAAVNALADKLEQERDRVAAAPKASEEPEGAQS